jgi:hypothetical protein
MEKPSTFTSFPLGYVVITNAANLLTYGLGAVIVAVMGWWAVVAYLVFCVAFELDIMARGCVDCYYYGKTCAYGKGRLCALLFSRGDPKRFAAREISWAALVPDFLIFLVPAVVGAVYLFIGFAWWRAALIGALLVVFAFRSVAVHILFSCRFCRQREIGCPAEKLFSKEG